MLWGLQVKPPFHQPGRSRMKATLRSWLNRTSAVFLLHAAFLSPPDLQRNIVLCFSLFFCNCFSSGVSFLQHDECCSVVRLHFRDSKVTSSFSFKQILTTDIYLVNLLGAFFCFCHSGKIWKDSRLSLSFSIFQKIKGISCYTATVKLSKMPWI